MVILTICGIVIGFYVLQLLLVASIPCFSDSELPFEEKKELPEREEKEEVPPIDSHRWSGKGT